MTGEGNNTKFTAGAKSGYFKGKVDTQIEEIGKDIGEIKESLKTLNDCIVKMKIKMAGIGAVVSLVVTLMVLLAKEILKVK